MRTNVLQQFSIALLVAATVMSLAAEPVRAASEPDRLVTKAEDSFKDFQNDPQMSWIREHIGQAKAVVIVPEMRKAAFIVGGSGGRAVMLAKDPATGDWSGPAFYTIANASLGIQAGVEKSQVVMLVMTDNGMASLLKPQFKLGGDVSIATGPIGGGAERSITTDVVAFSRSKGIYGGINLDGTLIKASKEQNKQYYGQTVTPADILVRHSVHAAKAERLQDQIAHAAMK